MFSAATHYCTARRVTPAEKPDGHRDAAAVESDAAMEGSLNGKATYHLERALPLRTRQLEGSLSLRQTGT